MDNTEPAFLSLFIDTPIYLIEEPEFEEPPKSIPVSLSFEGDNQRGIVILIDTLANDFLASDQGVLLLKICEAVSLQLNDIAIINIQKNSRVKDSLDSILEYHAIISFGVNWHLATIEQQDSLYQPFVRDSKKILKAHSLDELLKNVEAKKALWKELKQFL